MNRNVGFLIGVALLGVIFHVNGHGRLWWPPGRGTIWHHQQFAHLNPPQNYNDNELNCGGFVVQHEINGGKCGVCGDDYRLPQPRPNEGGGTFGRGIIVENYKSGQVIDVYAQLTANHLGYIQFRLCPHNDPTTPADQACFDQNLLEVLELNGAPFSGTKVPVPADLMDYRVKLQLPPGLTCTQCVLQWHYLTGNSWGWCEDGTGAMGCGDVQETFRGCADIAIQ